MGAEHEDRLFVVSKTSGPTSFDVVRSFRRALGVKKVGHTGTLDPLACGVLLLCTGRATRAVEHFMDLEKEYEFDVRLGQATDTLDAEGEVVENRECDPFGEAVLRAVAREFVGTYRFHPPKFSAVKKGGRRLYEMARSGEDVEVPEREVTIHALDVLAYTHPVVTLLARCSRGTYVRSLAADFGGRLGVPAHVSRLTRRRVGPYRIESGFSSERIARGDVDGLAGIPIGEALSFLPAFVLDGRAARAVFDGTVPGVADVVRTEGTPVPGGAVRLVDAGGVLLAVGRRPSAAAAAHVQLVDTYRLYRDAAGAGR